MDTAQRNYLYYVKKYKRTMNPIKSKLDFKDKNIEEILNECLARYTNKF